MEDNNMNLTPAPNTNDGPVFRSTESVEQSAAGFAPPSDPPTYQMPPTGYDPYRQPPRDWEEPMSVGKWIVTMLILAIPCVGLIMLFVWGFGGGDNKSRANYCKATLIWALIAVALYLLLALVFGLAGLSVLRNTRYSDFAAIFPFL